MARYWTKVFALTFAIGVATGIVMEFEFGTNWATYSRFAGTFLGLLTPYPLLVGVTTVALFMMHGAIYGVMKTEDELHGKLRVWALRCIIFLVICAVPLTMATLLYVPHGGTRPRKSMAV